MAQRISCFVCNNRYISRGMRRVDFYDDEKIQIAIRYRQELNLLPIVINNETRICLNCSQQLQREIEALAEDLECLRLNVFKQTSTRSCMICNNVLLELHRLFIEARAQIFIDTTIYVPDSARVYQQHLDDKSFLLKIWGIKVYQ